MANPKILIIQFKRAGDVIVTLPTAVMLKRRFPHSEIHFMVDRAFAPLLENNPAIDRVIPYDRKRWGDTVRTLRAEKYEYIFDFQSSPRSALLSLIGNAACTAGYRVTFWGRVFDRTIRRPGSGMTVTQGKVSLLESVLGPLGNIPAPEIVLTSDERRWADTQRTGDQKIVGLVPTHRRASRKWHADSFVKLGRLMEQSGHTIWLFWGPGEQAEVEAIQRQLPKAWMIPPTSLRQMAALFARCEAVVTNDNGPKHLAIAMGIPTVTVYGPTDPLAWGSADPKHVALQVRGLRCLGCNLNTCPFGHECMTGVTPEDVKIACQSLLELRYATQS